MKRYLTLLILALILQTSGWSQNLDPRPDKGSVIKNTAPAYNVPENLLINRSVITPKTFKVQDPMFVQKEKVKPGQDSPFNEKALDSVVFMRPEGYFYAGLTPDYLYYFFYFLFGPAYSTGHWRNLSGGATSYEWTLPDPDGEVDQSEGAVLETIQTDEMHPEAYYPFNVFYSNPSLTATDDTTTMSYTLGGIDSTMMFTGGTSMNYLETGVGNYDVHKNLYAYYFEEGDYLFGSSNVNDNIDAIANYFEKPTHTYVLDSLWINAVYCTAPAGTEFNLIIHRVDNEGNFIDTIATATLAIEDVLGPYADDVLYTLAFGEFEVFDPDLGFEITQDYLEISDAIIVELNGFNFNDDIVFSVMAQEFDTWPTYENNAYLFYFEDEVRSFGRYTSGSTSLSFNLGLIYTYLFADESTFHVSADGGSKVFDITTYYNPDDAMWTEGNIPDWLDYAYAFDDNDWSMRLKITADALPGGTSEREDSITIATYGSKFTFYIHQSEVYDDSDEDDISAVDDQVESPVYLTNRDGEIYVTYPSEYNELMMIDLSGRIVEKHSLPVSGTFAFTPSVEPKGTMFLFQLTGKNIQSRTFKLVY